MIDYPTSLKGVGGAHTGIAPVNLLDVLDVNGNYYVWADRKILVPSAIVGVAIKTVPSITVSSGQFVAWSFPSKVTVSSPSDTSKGEASATLNSANLTSFGPCSVGEFVVSKAEWSKFIMPVLPSEAVIKSVSVVLTVAGSGSGADNLGTGYAFGYVQTANVGQSSGDFAGTYTREYYVKDVAAIDAAQLANVYAGAEIGQSGVYTAWDQQLSVSFVGVAIFYTLPDVVIGGVAASLGGINASVWYKPWLLSVPQFSFHRSLQTDIGSFVLQNLSGDTLSRDFEKIVCASALEGAFFIWRLWQPDAQAAWIEVHGTLSVGTIGPDTAQLKGAQLLNPSQDDTPLKIYCETCQLQWGGVRCGATESSECSYSYQTCQVPNRIMVSQNDYEKNYGEATANTALNTINRRRKI